MGHLQFKPPDRHPGRHEHSESKDTCNDYDRHNDQQKRQPSYHATL